MMIPVGVGSEEIYSNNDEVRLELLGFGDSARFLRYEFNEPFNQAVFVY